LAKAATKRSPAAISQIQEFPDSIAERGAILSICSQTRRHLVAIAKSLASEKRGLPEQLKTEYNQLERPDFVWHYLLQSFATMGSAKGWDGLIGNRDNYQRVTFDALSRLSPSRRLSVLEQTLRNAKVRWPIKKEGVEK
jgi:hypothetical protein